MNKSAKIAVKFKDVHYSDGPVTILKNITGTIAQGKITTLVGPSGAGKTTLFRLMNGLISPTKGQIHILDKDIEDYVPTELRRQVGLALQNATMVRGDIFNNLSLPRTLKEETLSKDEASSLLRAVGLKEGLLTRSVKDLSGGQRQKVSIARTLVNRPNILLLDEITSSLDLVSRQEIEELIVRINKEFDVTIIRITHSLDQAVNIGDYTWVLMNGELLESGESNLLLDPKNEQVKQFVEGKSHELSDTILSLIFVLIPLLLAKILRLELGKDIVVATVRSIIQLLIVGYILTFVFESEYFIYIILMITLMIGAAVHNARKKGASIAGITWKLIITFVFIEVFTQAILLGFKIIPAEAQYIIPISGMVVGNSMVLSILFLNRFTSEIEAKEEETELILSLGGTPKQAIHNTLITSIKASMIPTIESQKTIGLVQLPGMMSGQIIAGADPVEAVQFQLLILFLLLSTATVTSTLLGFLSYPTLFNKRMQLLKQTR